MPTPRILRLTLPILLMLASTSGAWHEKEHFAVTALAARILPPDMPQWFIDGVPDTSAHCAVDPDVFKDRETPTLNHAEWPEHFFDSEYLAGTDLPPLRFDYYKLCYQRNLDPRDVGTLPWSVTEWTQKLTMAFVEHRRWPDLQSTQNKALVYAGILAHYAGDLQQPLHTTVHYDGRVANPGDPSPRSGIHAKVDGLFRHLDTPGDQLVDGLTTESFPDIWLAVNAAIKDSNSLVDRVYELESGIPPLDLPIIDPAVHEFATQRMRASIRFIASLYRSAWENSATYDLPTWLDRSQLQTP